MKHQNVQRSRTVDGSHCNTRRCRGTSVRVVLVAVTVAMMTLASVVSGGLVVVSTALHRTTAEASGAVESIRLAEEAANALVSMADAVNAATGSEWRKSLQTKLAELRARAGTERERAALRVADSAVDSFLDSSREPLAPTSFRKWDAAHKALDELALASVDRARSAQAEAQRWDALSNRAGLAMAAFLIVGGVATILWLRSGAFAPLLRLARAMERFGRGDREARADESGAKELRDMSRCFNEMAAALAAQRSRQVAFLGGVAHDLRGPLSVLKVSLGALGPARPLPPEARLRESLARMERQVSHLERMVGDFLEVSRIEGSGLELKWDRHDARTLVREVVSCFVELAGPRMQVHVPEEPLHLDCDGLRIQQVLTNLLSNAIKYSPPGAAIDVTLSGSRGVAEISVSDQGVGISEEEQNSIFDPFRRAGLSTESVPGVGLGLYVVRRIVEAHEGRIAVRSTPGEGTTFRIRLPRRRSAPSQGESAAFPALAG